MKNILFVDDDEQFLDGIRALFRRRKGWNLFYAANAREALDILSREQFDVVVADMRMPGMNGAELLAEVQNLQPSAVRLILSGYSELRSSFRAAKSAHQFLSKPCCFEDLVAVIERVIRLQRVLVDPGVRETVSRVGSLPALPDVYLLILKELRKPEPSIQLLGDLVTRDVGISATLLKLVNSSFFGFFQHVANPRRAVTLLGTETLKGLILGAHLLSDLDIARLAPFALDTLWPHSMRVAACARAIAALEGVGKDVQEHCWCAGLLHDIGKLVLATEYGDGYLKVRDALRACGSLLEAERAALGSTHADVGGFLLGLWGVGEEVVEAVFDHHAPGRSGVAGFHPAGAVHVADALVHELDGKDGVFAALDREWLRDQNMEDRLEAWTEACGNIPEGGAE